MYVHIHADKTTAMPRQFRCWSPKTEKHGQTNWSERILLFISCMFVFLSSSNFFFLFFLIQSRWINLNFISFHSVVGFHLIISKYQSEEWAKTNELANSNDIDNERNAPTNVKIEFGFRFIHIIITTTKLNNDRQKQHKQAKIH